MKSEPGINSRNSTQTLDTVPLVFGGVSPGPGCVLALIPTTHAVSHRDKSLPLSSLAGNPSPSFHGLEHG